MIRRWEIRHALVLAAFQLLFLHMEDKELRKIKGG